MPFEEVKKVWMNGKLVDFADAKIHLFTHAIHYGSGLFEGIRCYVTKNQGPAIFRLKEHTRRLYDSAKIYRMEIPYTAGLILLDGADLPMMCLLQEVDVKDVRIGMRLEAVWVDDADLKPNLESIKYFRPIDEPDVEVRQPGKGVTW